MKVTVRVDKFTKANKLISTLKYCDKLTYYWPCELDFIQVGLREIFQRSFPKDNSHINPLTLLYVSN